MRALVLDDRLAFRPDYPAPARAAGESLVRVKLAGICGTDLELARGYMGYRGVPGHEFVGEVVETDAPALRGRRVVGEINAACGSCAMCRHELGRHCYNRTVLGIQGRDGAFAETLALPDRNLWPVAGAVADEAVVFVEPLAAAYEILEQVRLDGGESILVLGDGRMGAITALMLQAQGIAPQLAGRHPDKLRRLLECGVREVAQEHELRPGFDVVVDCTGSPAGFARAVELVRPRGKLVLKSTVAGAERLDLAPVVVKEITVIGSRCGRFGPALEALGGGRVDPRPLISAVFGLEDGAAAFEAAGRSPNFKVLLKP